MNRRFDHHPPKDALTIDQHQDVRAGCKLLAALVDEVCPEGREKALALTKIEEAMFWANASIARDGSK
ncbi:hypothetical protein E6W39_18905 [Kitasatospora acidiphila]|uniref:Acb2/Tad1 hairpin domain-containing protein n=1 Tax=Kitasatospora acidiphila TaxID=2567942 RepID=A0A540WEI3_9ACTN|nr:hypothetical protein E6W39_18905 [Kitasatospora acidiphila]